MAKVGIFFADGCEEIEGLAVVDICRRAGLEIETISIMGRDIVAGSHRIKFQTDAVFEDVEKRIFQRQNFWYCRAECREHCS